MVASLDRRTFVGVGATALATIGALGLTGCGSTAVEDEGSAATEEADDETKISEMTEEELQAAWEQEEAYGQTIVIDWDGGLCTSPYGYANYLGYFEEEGLDVEIVNTSNVKEAVGTGQAQTGASHLAELLVPAVNDIGLTLVHPFQTGCQSLYVLADSEYESLEDLVGCKISVPNGLGTADQNILYRFLLADGIDLDAVDYTVVTYDAVVTALQNDEVQATMMSDMFAYDLVQDGTLRYVRSITYDDDFADEPCCMAAINTDFLETNPVTCYKLVRTLERARQYIVEYKEEAAAIAIEQEFASGSEERALDFLNQWDWEVSVQTAEESLREIIADYETAEVFEDNTEDVEEALARVWYPVIDS